MTSMQQTVGSSMVKPAVDGAFQGSLLRIMGTAVSRCFLLVFGTPE